MKTVEKIQRKIITVDAENKSLGRLAVEVAVRCAEKTNRILFHIKIWEILFL